MRILAGDLVTRTIRAEVPFADVSYDLPLNDHGTFNGTVPARLATATSEILDPGATAIYVIENGGNVDWAGILWVADPSDDGSSLSCTATEFGSYFTHRFMDYESVTYPDVDQLTIARDLVTRAQAQVGGNIWIEHYDTRVSGVTQYKDYHEYEAPEVMQSIKDLGEADKGFDWEFFAAWSGNETFPRRYFRLHYPRRGHRTSNVLELGTNVTLINNSVDATEMANQCISLGNGEGSSMIRARSTDTSKFSRYPLLQKVNSYKDVNFQSELQARTDIDLKIANRPNTAPSVELREHPGTPWGSFSRGDDVFIRGHDGYTQLDGYYRVTRVSTKIAGGSITRTIDTVDADSFQYGQIPVDESQAAGYNT